MIAKFNTWSTRVQVGDYKLKSICLQARIPSPINFPFKWSILVGYKSKYNKGTQIKFEQNTPIT